MIKFYTSPTYSDEDTDLAWDEILDYFQNNDPKNYVYKKLGRFQRTFLHMHLLKLRSVWLSGIEFGDVENEAVDVLKHLLQVSVDMYEKDGIILPSGLSVVSDGGDTCLHSLFALSGYNDRYIYTVMNFCLELMEGYWTDLLRMKNSHGATPLHSLIGSDVSTMKTIVNSIEECSIENHPLLIPDSGGELPLHLACDASLDRKMSGMLEVYLGRQGIPLALSSALDDTVFHESNHGQVPISILLSSYLEDDFDLDEFECQNSWFSSGLFFVPRLQTFLSSKRTFADVDSSAFRKDSRTYQIFIAEFNSLLSAAVRSMETKFTERQRKTWKRPTLTVHMAASIPKYPTFALQLPLLLNHKSIRQFDENHKIPLHYAVMCASEDHDHCKSNFHDLYWGSGIEHRSIVQYLIEYAPDTTLMRDGDGRLPLHLAVINGTFEGSIQSLLNLNPSQVKDIDPVSGLYPFMLAASEGQNVNIIFNLLLLCPTLAYTSESVHK